MKIQAVTLTALMGGFLFLAGCEKKSAESKEAVLPDSVSAQLKNQAGENKTTGEPDPSVDFDFTVLNYDDISTKIFEMMIDSDAYLGKTVKFKGLNLTSGEENIGEKTHSVILWDSTACCQVGFPFELKQGAAYPAEKEEIIIKGKFSYKTLNGMDYYYVMCDSYESCTGKK